MATNLEFIKQASVTSNSSSISVTDCFSSKYDHYQVVLAVDDVDAEVAIEFRMINSSGVNTSSNYDHANLFMRAGSGSTTDGSTQANDKWQYCMYAEGYGGGFCVMNVFNPANSSTFAQAYWDLVYDAEDSYTRRYVGAGNWATAGAINNIKFAPSGGVWNSGKLCVYGVKNS